MKRVTGLGGIFFKCNDAKAVAAWYQKHLGINLTWGTSGMFEWRDVDNPEQKGTSVWATFEKETKYFDPGKKEFMVNYRVENLKELLEELKKEGVEVVGDMQEYDYGKFGWIMDPEGNKIELWEPID